MLRFLISKCLVLEPKSGFNNRFTVAQKADLTASASLGAIRISILGLHCSTPCGGGNLDS